MPTERPTEKRPPVCPRCRETLQEETLAEALVRIETLACKRCGGRFFRAGDLEEVDDIIEPRWFEVRRIPEQQKQYESLTCPACRPARWMDKCEHRRDKKVVVDLCPGCRGAWLDGGELAAIQIEALPTFLRNTFRWLRGRD